MVSYTWVILREFHSNNFRSQDSRQLRVSGYKLLDAFSRFGSLQRLCIHLQLSWVSVREERMARAIRGLGSLTCLTLTALDGSFEESISFLTSIKGRKDAWKDEGGQTVDSSFFYNTSSTSSVGSIGSVSGRREEGEDSWIQQHVFEENTNILGFDIEWKPVFQRWEVPRIAIIQSNRCILLPEQIFQKNLHLLSG
jgi:hypothetical protein